jgi:hypothetical protein
MTKQYPLVYISDEMYMINKNAKIEAGNYVNDAFTGIKFVKNEPQAHYYITYPWVGDKILASSDKSLNLPLLPAVENDKDIRVKGALAGGKIYTYNDENNQLAYGGYLRGYVDGHKANTKEYTIADIEAAVAFGVALERFRSTRTFSDEEEFKGFLEGLKPKPVSVEVEVSFIKPWNKDGSGEYFVEVDENNFIKPIKWIYE